MSQPVTNHIKIGASAINSISVGDFSVGVSGGADYGPTSDTGFYNGIVPPSGGYVIYVSKVSQGPSIHVAYNDSDCVQKLLKMGSNANNISDALTWAGTQSNILVRSSEYQLSDLPNTVSFTIGTNDFSGYYTGGNVSASGVSGFSNSGGYDVITDTYILHTPTNGTYTNATNAAYTAGMNYTVDSYVWNVTWADNSTGLVRVGLSTWQSGQIVLSPIETTDTSWQTSDYYGSTSKSGTFNFPATFTPYTPLTTLGPNDWWC